MKKLVFPLILILLSSFSFSGEVKQTYYFNKHTITLSGPYHVLHLGNTRTTGKTGEPALPYCPVSLILPPGEAAVSIKIQGDLPVILPGQYNLAPVQEVRPLSAGKSGKFVKNESVYLSDSPYPAESVSHLKTAWLNGVSMALSTFTPVTYHPKQQTLAYYSRVTVTITTAPDPESATALTNLSASPAVRNRILQASQNPEKLETYPSVTMKKSGYQILIVTPEAFQNGFSNLINFYNTKGINALVKTTQEIGNTIQGADLQEKIRNYIIQEYQGNGIEHVLLGGDTEHVPYRGFYCYVVSGWGYEDDNIPADLYYSALDGNWNTNGNNRWGEPGEDDLLPDISVARMPFGNLSEQENMIHKSISYQQSPVTGELTRPLMVGEHLYSTPMTWGQDYLELLIGDHNDNGYFTHGIPEQDNQITRLYDSMITPGNMYQWTPDELIGEINEGHSFIHHCGHSNVDYMMRLYSWDITNATFPGLNGVTHNYPLLYSHGCLCGAFDNGDCIAEKMVTIDNFVSAAVVNSRYGWFNQGETEGPSAHLHREFISALYNDTLALSVSEIGSAHMMSKIKTAPWVTIPNQFEPGAQRWCFYCCNVLGDPAMNVWTDEPNVGIPDLANDLSVILSPNPVRSMLSISLRDHPAQNVHIRITTVSGTTILDLPYQISDNTNQVIPVDMRNLAQGIYFITIRSGSSLITKKVVKLP